MERTLAPAEVALNQAQHAFVSDRNNTQRYKPQDLMITPLISRYNIPPGHHLYVPPRLALTHIHQPITISLPRPFHQPQDETTNTNHHIINFLARNNTSTPRHPQFHSRRNCLKPQTTQVTNNVANSISSHHTKTLSSSPRYPITGHGLILDADMTAVLIFFALYENGNFRPAD
jgi:hypothetical protein